MNFTTKKSVASVVGGALTIAVVGLIGWVNYAAPAPIVTTHNTIAVHEAFQPDHRMPITPAVLVTPALAAQTGSSYYYQPVSSKSSHWWKRNAPIVGGAAGGALVGGLVGGPTGMIVGGAAGGGGGYLYKRSRHHHHHY